MLKGDFSFHRYIKSLDETALVEFAQSAGTTAQYIKRHLIYKFKTPRNEMIDALVSASNGAFTKEQYVIWLYDLNAEYITLNLKNTNKLGDFKHVSIS